MKSLKNSNNKTKIMNLKDKGNLENYINKYKKNLKL